MTRTALITGASQGLGLALARQLARDNWHLIVTARSTDSLEAARSELAQNTTVTAVQGDVSDPAHRQQLAASIPGTLDLVVNNASTLGLSPMPALLDFPLDVLEQVYRVNVIAPLGIIQTVYPKLSASARIINITSDAGAEAYAGWGGYGSSKAALEHLTAILAAEHPERKIYWVDPGDMRTQMHQDAFPGEDISDRPLPEASIPGFLKLIDENLPSGRYQAQRIAVS